MTRAFHDGLAIIVNGLQTQFPDLWVANRLPEDPESELPAIWVNPIPGATRFKPWGPHMPLEDVPAFDVDVLAKRSAGWATMNNLADSVRRALYNLPGVDHRVRETIEDVPFTPRPDWNDRVIRVGGEYSLRIPRSM